MKRLHDEFEEGLANGNVPEEFIVQVPNDIWITILASSSNWTVGDIKKMCTVSKQFAKICKSGNIWNAVVQRQYGEKALNHLGELFKNEKTEDTMLYRLMAYRIFMNRQTTINGYWIQGTINTQDVKLNVAKRNENSLSVEFSYLYWGTQEGYQTRPNKLAPQIYAVWKEILGSDSIEQEHNVSSVGDIEDWASLMKEEYVWKFNLPIEETVIDDAIIWSIYVMIKQGGFVFHEPDLQYSGSECAWCKTKASLYCGKCYTTAYCSEKCATLDWTIHQCSRKV